ncbi:diguanylate cyclase [Campylobacter canadensis]|uniref:diguanylate cyclase n=3 Tax=Campylobacter canadensis TaxID=449520 RepID=UPI001CCC964C|nr:diguanylate cyclase [Campylobacter canadensis]MBZ7996575.1 diguanylate cyclase [Campylobacter canadensis]MBZ8001901.1 diguanylate cyclase [Campylobacter canadensis]
MNDSLNKKIQEAVWSSDLDIGLEEVDSEHRIFMDLIKKAYISINNSYVEFDKNFKEIIQHLLIHFRNEEAFMKAQGIYSKYIEEHQVIHSDFIIQIQNLQRNFIKVNSDSEVNYQVAFAINAIDFIKEWLIFHIVGQDSDIAKQIELIQDKHISAEEAYKTMQESKNKNVSILIKTINSLLKILEIRNSKLNEIEQDVENRLKKSQEENERIISDNKMKSLTDQLTGIFNRRYAMELLEDISKNENLIYSIISFDLDGFKGVNDTYGHEAGDKVLKVFSNTVEDYLIRANYRGKDPMFHENKAFFCRFGGDEFAIILPNTNIDDALKLANGIHAAINNITVYTDAGVVLWKGKSSLGVASKSLEHTTYNDVIKEADEYLYEVKNSGKNRVGSRNTKMQQGGGVSL